MEPEFYESRGTTVAPTGGVARRIAAFIGMVVILVIVIVVMWQIYLHHGSAAPRDEPTIVQLASAIC